MRIRVFIAAGAVFGLAGCQTGPMPGRATCTPLDGEAVMADMPDRGAYTASLMRLEACLASPDPVVRDDLAYAQLTAAMRSKHVMPDEARAMMGRLEAALALPDADGDGFHRPFAALVLSEIARMDRIDAFLTQEERSALVHAGAGYLADMTDYRGYVEGEGWRHGVAHTADLFMQLSLNPRLTPDQAVIMLDAIGAKVAPQGRHAYVFGEPERLARPVLYLVLNDASAGTDWAAWFAALGPQADEAGWQDTYASEEKLARLHNVRAFAQAVYVATSQSENPAFIPMNRAALDLLNSLP